MSALETVDIHGIEVLSTGGPVKGVGSPAGGDYYTRNDLVAMAAAHRTLGNEVRAPIKLGHSDRQLLAKNSGLTAGELPALGWLDSASFRVEDDPETGLAKLVADAKAVPKKVADLMRAGAYRTRSSELSRVTSQRTGRSYGVVVSGLALLGNNLPAIQTLDDIVALYERAELDRPDDVSAYVMYAAADQTRTAIDFGTVNAADFELSDAQLHAAGSDLNLKPSSVAGYVTTTVNEYLARLGRESEFQHETVPTPPNLGPTISPIAKKLLLSRVSDLQSSQTPGSKIQLDLDLVTQAIEAWDPAAASEGRELEALVDVAIADGRIPVRQRERWLERMAASPREFAAILEERRPDRNVARANARKRTREQDDAHRAYGGQLKEAFPWL